METHLGTLEEESVDLSGGQWQKIGIARGYGQGHKFMIMDEPTAALDPIEEVRLYRDYLKTMCRQNAIIVTHRLGMVRFADEIIVIKDGTVHSKGPHEELIKKDPYYANMYNTSKKYLEEK